MKRVLFVVLGILAGALALLRWATSEGWWAAIEVSPQFAIFCLTAVAGYLIWRFPPSPEKVAEVIKGLPMLAIGFLVKDLIIWIIEYLPPAVSMGRLSVFFAVVLMGSLIGVLAQIIVPSFRQDQVSNLKTYADQITRGVSQFNLWPYAIVGLGIPVMGVAFCVCAPAGPYAEFGFGVLIFITLIWSAFLPLIVQSGHVLWNANRRRPSGPPSLTGLLDDLAIQDAANGIHPNIRPR